MNTLNGIQQLKYGQIPYTTKFPLALLNIRMVELAERWGIQTEFWEEDGLGNVAGAFLRIPGGKVVQLMEAQHAIKLGSKGPTILIDMDDPESLPASTIGLLLDEVVEALGIEKDEIDWSLATALAIRTP